MMDDYGSGAGKSSAGMKDKFRSGSLDARTHKRDMYDEMGPMEKSASKPASATMNSGKDMSQPANISHGAGEKDYGKGNPYKKGGKPKATFKSIEELRAYAEKMG